MKEYNFNIERLRVVMMIHYALSNLYSGNQTTRFQCQVTHCEMGFIVSQWGTKCERRNGKLFSNMVSHVQPAARCCIDSVCEFIWIYIVYLWRFIPNYGPVIMFFYYVIYLCMFVACKWISRFIRVPTAIGGHHGYRHTSSYCISPFLYKFTGHAASQMTNNTTKRFLFSPGIYFIGR